MPQLRNYWSLSPEQRDAIRIQINLLPLYRVVGAIVPVDGDDVTIVDERVRSQDTGHAVFDALHLAGFNPEDEGDTWQWATSPEVTEY